MADDKNMPALVSNGSEEPVESLAAEKLGENDATEAPAVGHADNQPANEAGGAEDEAQNSDNDNEDDEEDEEDDDDYNSAEDSEGSSDGGEDDDQQGSSLTALLLGASGSASADLGEGDDDDDDDDDFVASKPVKKHVRMAASAKRGREEGDPEPARKKTKV